MAEEPNKPTIPDGVRSLLQRLGYSSSYIKKLEDAGKPTREAIARVQEASQRPNPPSDESLRGDIVRAIDEHPAHETSSKFDAADKAVFGICELLGLIFGLPFGEDMYHGTPVTGWHWFYLAIGVVFAGAGPMFPWIRTRTWIPANVSASLSRAALDARIWIAALLLLFVYGTAPEMYRRATLPQALPPIDTGSAQSPPSPPPPPPPPPSAGGGHSKQAIPELLAESGVLLNIVQKTIVPLEHEWRVSLGGKNPQLICLGRGDPRTLQDDISKIAERLGNADKAILEFLDQNGLDRAELAPLIGYQNTAIDDPKPKKASSYLMDYRNIIKNLGDKPSCDVVIAQDIPRHFYEMTNVLNSFNEWLTQSEDRLKKYRDALRIEARNAP